VPVPTLAHIVQSSGNVFRQGKLSTMSHRRIDVAVRDSNQPIPQRMVTLGRHLVGFPRLITEEGDYGVLAEVLGSVLFGVVRAHLLLIDVLLEDVAQYIRVDLVVVMQRTFIQMPVVLVKEVEQFFKSFILNLERFAVYFLNLM